MNRPLVEKIIEALDEDIKIFIGSHISPDGDNLGSSLGLYNGLKELGKDVEVLYVDTIPDDYKFLPGLDSVRERESYDEDYIFIAVDSADLERLGRNKELASSAKILINIDHHGSNPNYGHINYVDNKASATGELIYYILRELGALNKESAICIYTAISTDTGSFMYSNTTWNTHLIASELMKYDIDTNLINVNLYQNNPYKKIQLFSSVLSELEIFESGKVLIGELTEEKLELFASEEGDSEGLVEEIRNIRGVELAILLKEKEGSVRVSLRSKNYIDCSKICLAFNGGGHERAAGCTINSGLEEAKIKVLEKVGEQV